MMLTGLDCSCDFHSHLHGSVRCSYRNSCFELVPASHGASTSALGVASFLEPPPPPHSNHIIQLLGPKDTFVFFVFVPPLFLPFSLWRCIWRLSCIPTLCRALLSPVNIYHSKSLIWFFCIFFSFTPLHPPLSLHFSSPLSCSPSWVQCLVCCPWLSVFPAPPQKAGQGV